MWGLTIVVSAFAAAIVAMSLTFMGGAVVVAIPLAIIAIAITALIDFNRQRKTAQSIHSQRSEDERVEFTESDRRTLVSE
jgi:hypothetical protein